MARLREVDATTDTRTRAPATDERQGELERRNRNRNRSPVALLAHAREYPRAIWLLTLANTVLWIGRGMSLPFTFIFFSDVAGLSASLVGGGIALSVVVASVFVIGVAGQIDARGAKPVLVLSIGMVGVVTLFYGWVTTPATFLVATAALTMFDQLYWPSINSTAVPLVGPARAAQALALLRCAFILGSGLGGLIGGVMVAGGGLDEYRVMWIVSAIVIVAAALMIWRLVPLAHTPTHDQHGLPGRWHDVVDDRLNLATLGVMLVVILGYAQLQISVPAFIHQEAGINEGTIGVLIVLKMLLTLALLLPVAARVALGSLGQLLSVASRLFLAGLLAVALTPSAGVPVAALVFLLFTAGELLFAPVTSLVPVRLAPAHLRGRYFAAQSMMWGLSRGLSSLAAGIALDSSRPVILWPILAALMVVAALWSWRLRGAPRLAA